MSEPGMTRLKRGLFPLADLFLVPLVYPSGWLLRRIRRAGVQNLPRVRRALLQLGVFPIRNHYYEPQFDYRNPKADLSDDRPLPGIDWNIGGQLAFLDKLTFAGELADLRGAPAGPGAFDLDNGAFRSGDAEFWYQVIRALKPRRIIEVGSGHSTLLAIRAVEANRREAPRYECEHVCIEPFEMPWLEKAGVSVIRKKVEDVPVSCFAQLRENDLLFIDSSHVIRPQGDVLFEYLEVLPTLAPGVVVHVHDVFSPRNYPGAWLEEQVLFWNEQYLLEAFLTHNRSWEILGAVNYLHHHHPERLRQVAPFLTPEREPGSFYLRRRATRA